MDSVDLQVIRTAREWVGGGHRVVLATVIIAALIGAGGLGLVAYEATAKPNIKLGQGVTGGLAIVLLAIMLDRITQAWGTSKQGGNHQ